MYQHDVVTIEGAMERDRQRTSRRAGETAGPTSCSKAAASRASGSSVRSASSRRPGYRFERVAGTSAGSIVGALVAAGMTSAEMYDVMTTLDYAAFRDPTLLTRIPVVGQLLSLLVHEGVYAATTSSRSSPTSCGRRVCTTWADLRPGRPGQLAPTRPAVQAGRPRLRRDRERAAATAVGVRVAVSTSTRRRSRSPAPSAPRRRSRSSSGRRS